MTHKCPAPGCETQVRPDKLSCHQHWFTIPKPLRDDVWATYKAGPGSDAHRSAVKAAIDYLEAAAHE